MLDISFAGQLVNTVVMNPPFGTRKKGSDMEFLSIALKVRIDFLSYAMPSSVNVSDSTNCYQVASEAVYSFHKTTTRDVSSYFCNV